MVREINKLDSIFFGLAIITYISVFLSDPGRLFADLKLGLTDEQIKSIEEVIICFQFNFLYLVFKFSNKQYILEGKIFSITCRDLKLMNPSYITMI